MELSVRKSQTARFELPSANTSGVTATYSFNGSAPTTLPAPTIDDEVAIVDLPYQPNEGTVTVSWTFTEPGSGSFTEAVDYEVVTPLLTAREVKEIVPSFSDWQATRVEASVRYLIQSIVGQTFGKYQAVYTIHGDNSHSLELPHHLITLNSVNDVTDVATTFEITGGGWALAYYPFGVPSVKADFDGLHYTTNGVITNPWSVDLADFRKSMIYEIDGIWGWPRVPEEIKEAARILVNDLACADSEYRDRFLTSMTAADWRIQFNDRAFAGTGNARADKILEPFILGPRWVAI